MLALPICSCIRLYFILFSTRWRSVVDWALTHISGIICIAIGCYWHSDYAIYFLAAGAMILCTFPVFTFERIFGKILPQKS